MRRGVSLVLGRLLCGTRPPFCRAQNPVQWQAQALGGTGLALSFTTGLSQHTQSPLALVPNLRNGKNNTDLRAVTKGELTHYITRSAQHPAHFKHLKMALIAFKLYS